MKHLLRFKTFLILALLAMVGNSAWAQDESVTFSSQGYTNAQEISSYSGTSFSVTFAKGTNSNNAPKYYNTGKAIRCYGGNTITVSSSTKTIASVQFSFGSSDGSNAITASVGDYSQGEWTGSANSVTFTIGGSSGNRRIAGISVTYEAGGDPTVPQKVNPELAWSASSASAIVGEDFTAPTLTNPNNVAVTYESTNESVATISANGEVSVVAAGETTIKAVFAGDDTYNAQTVSYTLTVTAPAVVYTSLKDLQDNVTSTPQDFTLQMTDIYVTAVKNKNAYISDGTYGALIYTDGHGLEAGQKLNGTLSAKYVLYHGQTEITNFSTSGLTITSEALPAQTKAIGDLSGANQSLLVTLENVTYDGTVLTDGTNSITPYTTFMSDLGLESGKTYNVTGIVILYNTTLEIAPRKAEDIVEVGAPATPSITLPAGYQFEVNADGGDNELPVTCSNLAAEPQLAVVFYESDGETSATYDWITATINNNGNIDGHIETNTGAERTAYFKVTGKDADGGDVYSDLVTITQNAPAAVSIVFNPSSIDFEANGGSKTIGGDYFNCQNFDSTPSFEILFYESDGETSAAYDWITASFNADGKIDLVYNENTGAARTAYLKIHAVGTTVYSNLFTVNQAAAATPDVAHYYQKVSSSADLTNGDYLIVCEEGNVAFNGGLETLDAVSNTIEVKIADHKIASSETVDAAVFTIDTTAGTLLSASGLYIGQTTDGNGMKSSAETPYENTLQVDTDGNADIESAGAYLRYNAASNQERFRYYKSSSYTGQKVIQLYKRMDGEMPAASPALAVTPDVVTVPYTGGADSFTVTPSNVENAFGGYVTFYDPTDTETTVDQPNWIGISYDYSNMSLSYTITDENNTGAERTACFKYFIMCDNGGAMSNLVTVKQEAYVAPVASIAVDPIVVNATSVATEGTIAVTYNNITEVLAEAKFYEADGTTEATYDWIEAEINADNNVYYVIDENNGVARTAYLKVYALDDDANDVYSELITINQAAYVAPALTQINLTKTLVFDTSCGLATGSYAANDALTELSGTFEGDANATSFGGFTIKDSYINGSSIQMKKESGSITFPTIVSEYGFDVNVVYQTNEAKVYINGVESTEASAGNTSLMIATGDKYCQITSITLTPKTNVTTPSITLPAGYQFEVNADGGDNELPVTCSNLAADPQLAVVFCDANGDAVADDTYDWITAVINANGNIDGHIDANIGDARTAYFKVSGKDADDNTIYSNLVTINQAAPAAPSIVFNPASIDFDANSGNKTIGGDYFQLKDFDSTPSLEILYYESDGDTERQGGYDWLTADFNSNNQIDFTWGTNTGAARSAYLKIHAVGTTVYSNLFTVNQAGVVVDYATLPFSFDGGRADVEGTNGLTQEGLDSDYASTPKLKFNSTGDALVLKFNERPGKLTFDIKGNSFSGGTFTVQTSEDGVNYTDLKTYTELGATQSETFNTLGENVRYIKWVYTEKSAGNVALGNIALKKYTDTPVVVVAAPTFNPEGMEVEAGFVVTITSEVGTVISYTTDGTDPAESATAVLTDTNTASVEVNADMTIRAIALDNELNQSVEVSESYTVAAPVVVVGVPVITVDNGLITIVPGSDNAQVIYTTDGTDPTYEPLNGTVYTEPFNITVDTTIKAIGVDNNGNVSEVVTIEASAEVVDGVKYYKVTSTDQLEEGVDYLLVYEGVAGEGAAAYGGLNSYTNNSYGKSVELKHIGGSVVTITDEEVVPVTLKSRSEDGTKWAMRDATGWIAAINGNNLHGNKSEDDAVWTFDFTAEAHKQIFHEFSGNIDTRYLEYNTNNPRFAGYTGTQSAVYLYKAASYNVSVGATGYATLYYGTKNLVVPENVEAYTYTVNNGKLEESYLYSTNEVIPAGTGVVLKAPAGEYKFAVTTEAGLEDTDNLLFGFDTPSTTVAPAAGDYLFYLLGVDNGKVGFYWGTAKGAAFTSGAHKAYLAVPTEVAAGVRGFTFDGTTVGINTIGVDMPEGNAYDLQGRRVQQLQKNGLYIVDGKKMLAK